MEPNLQSSGTNPEELEFLIEDPVSAQHGISPVPTGSTGLSIMQYVVLVATGAFATTFAQQQVLAKLPITYLLKTDLKYSKEQVALFLLISTFAWNVKPIAGIFTDAFPLFGTRRKHYMIFGSMVAGLGWLIMGQLSTNVQLLLIVAVLMNMATVLSSTVMGGLMVEAGQAFKSPGRIASLRQLVQSFALIAGPLVGGALAEKKFGYKLTTSIAACTVFSLAIVAMLFLKEKSIKNKDRIHDLNLRRPEYRVPLGVTLVLGAIGVLIAICFSIKDLKSIGISLLAMHLTFDLILGLVFLPTTNPVIVKAQHQLVDILRSRTLWMAVIMLFLVYMVPGLNTSLNYHQLDVLKMPTELIGQLESLEGFFGVIAAVGYALFCRKLNLRKLLIGAIWLNGAFTLTYLYYTKSSAPFIHSVSGLVGVMSELALMDLAVRSTPKGSEALGFALMMSVRNFGIGISNLLGAKLMDNLHFTFNTLVWVNALTTMSVLLFVPFLPKLVMMRKEGEG